MVFVFLRTPYCNATPCMYFVCRFLFVYFPLLVSLLFLQVFFVVAYQLLFVWFFARFFLRLSLDRLPNCPPNFCFSLLCFFFSCFCCNATPCMYFVCRFLFVYFPLLVCLLFCRFFFCYLPASVCLVFCTLFFRLSLHRLPNCPPNFCFSLLFFLVLAFAVMPHPACMFFVCRFLFVYFLLLVCLLFCSVFFAVYQLLFVWFFARFF